MELSGAHSTTAAVARSALTPMPIINQKPDRVSNILRSSTATIRDIGIGAGAFLVRGGAGALGVAMAVLMLLLLQRWSWCRAGSRRSAAGTSPPGPRRRPSAAR